MPDKEDDDDLDIDDEPDDDDDLDNDDDDDERQECDVCGKPADFKIEVSFWNDGEDYREWDQVDSETYHYCAEHNPDLPRRPLRERQ